MAITAAQVNELRKKTGAGMMDCKKALAESNGDFEKAIEILRKKGASIASKRADKSANEGIVVAKVSDDYKKAAMIEVNCETDFVAKSDDFIKLANEIVEETYKSELSSAQQLLETDTSLSSKVVDVMGKVGEKIEVSRILTEKAENGLIVDYIHMGSKLGVLVKFDNVTTNADELVEIGKNIAMQVAAMNPVAVDKDDVPEKVLAQELEIGKEQARREGKPEEMLEKIAQGKLNKFFKESTLMNQEFVKDNKLTIRQYLESKDKALKATAFIRFTLNV